jgi:hypothetical protein
MVSNGKDRDRDALGSSHCPHKLLGWGQTQEAMVVQEQSRVLAALGPA